MKSIPVSSIYQLVCLMENTHGNHPAMRYYDDSIQGVREISYLQYAADIRRVAAELKSLVPDLAGQRVCILAGNSYHFAVSIFGVLLSGAVVVPLNLQKNWEEIQYEIDLVEPCAILEDGLFLERESRLKEFYGDKLLPITGYQNYEPAEASERADYEGLAAIMFTSGTTGHSKGVMLSEKNLFAPMPTFCDPFDVMLKDMGVETYDFNHFTVLPMFHIAAFTSLISWAIKGGTHNLCTDLRNFYRDLALMPSDAMAVVPVLLKSIHHDVMKTGHAKFGKLRILTCGAATYDPKILIDLMKEGFFVMQMYGLTETTGDGTWNNSQEESHLSSVGVGDEPICEYKIEDGELCIKGSPLMMGYYKNPEATAEVMVDGWFHTGDLVRKDEEGYYYITGRKKNLIILSSGENVSPEELEKLLSPCSEIRETIVKEKGDRICAVVSCSDADQDKVRAFVTELNRTLPLYKRISQIEFHSEPLPRNATGKLLRT